MLSTSVDEMSLSREPNPAIPIAPPSMAELPKKVELVTVTSAPAVMQRAPPNPGNEDDGISALPRALLWVKVESLISATPPSIQTPAQFIDEFQSIHTRTSVTSLPSSGVVTRAAPAGRLLAPASNPRSARSLIETLL